MFLQEENKQNWINSPRTAVERKNLWVNLTGSDKASFWLNCSQRHVSTNLTKWGPNFWQRTRNAVNKVGVYKFGLVNWGKKTDGLSGEL